MIIEKNELLLITRQFIVQCGKVCFVSYRPRAFYYASIYDSIIRHHLKTEIIILECKYSKAKKLFHKTSEQVERLTEIVFMVVVKTSTQLGILPKIIVSLGVYIFTASGNDSFQLPYPMW